MNLPDLTAVTINKNPSSDIHQANKQSNYGFPNLTLRSLTTELQIN